MTGRSPTTSRLFGATVAHIERDGPQEPCLAPIAHRNGHGRERIESTMNVFPPQRRYRRTSGASARPSAFVPTASSRHANPVHEAEAAEPMSHQLVGRIVSTRTPQATCSSSTDRDAGTLQVPTESADELTARQRRAGLLHIVHGLVSGAAEVVAQARRRRSRTRAADFSPDLCEQAETQVPANSPRHTR
jgi:hypothetical protein